MQDYPTIIVDSFFKYPLDVREFALSLEYSPHKDGLYSGKRTQSLHDTHPNFFYNVCDKILACYSLKYTEYSARMHFHLTDERAGSSGWVHTDDGILSSIIYLNLNNNNLENGTNIFKLRNLNHTGEQVSLMRDSFITGNDNEQAKNLHNKDFTPTLCIGSIFNRMAAYDGTTCHSGMGYYGNNETTSRLTLLTFFYDIKIIGNKPTGTHLSPIRAANLITDL